MTDELQPIENKHSETLKPLCNTRWPAHADATLNYVNIQKLQEDFVNDTNQMQQLEMTQDHIIKKKWAGLKQPSCAHCGVALQAVELDLCKAVDLERS